MLLKSKALVQMAKAPLLLLYLLSYLVPKKKNLILVGEWGGELRGDNAVCLGELLQKDAQNLQIFYLQHAASNRADTVRLHSIRSIVLHLRARGFIVGSGKKDLLSAFITRKSILINTWHGLPIKKIHYMVKSESPLLKIRDFAMPFFDETPDFALAHGDFKIIMEKAFRPRIGVIDMPQPKWKNTGEGEKDDLILYAPTFRDGNLGHFPVSELELKRIDALLDNKDYKLMITLHPATKYQCEISFSNIIINGRDSDLNLYSDILPRCRLVISDISSVLIDASYFGIPTKTYFPDEEAYRKESRAIIEHVFSTYCSDRITTLEDVFGSAIARLDRDGVGKFDRVFDAGTAEVAALFEQRKCEVNKS